MNRIFPVVAISKVSFARELIEHLELMIDQFGEDGLTEAEFEKIVRAGAEAELVLSKANLAGANLLPIGKAVLAVPHVEIKNNVACCHRCRQVLAVWKQDVDIEEVMRQFAEVHAKCYPRKSR